MLRICSVLFALTGTAFAQADLFDFTKHEWQGPDGTGTKVCIREKGAETNPGAGDNLEWIAGEVFREIEKDGFDYQGKDGADFFFAKGGIKVTLSREPSGICVDYPKDGKPNIPSISFAL